MDIKQVTETIAMIEEQNFDVRTITMGISLLDCIDPDIEKAAEKVYNKIVTKAKDLVAVGDEIAAELGLNIDDISQTVLDEFFTMMAVVSSEDKQDFTHLRAELEAFGESLNVKINIQSSAIFDAMHNL